MKITEEQLTAFVNGAKEKDTKSIEGLYNEFYDDVYYICYKILGNSDDAKDITQDTFIEIFVSIDSLKDPLAFKGWIGRIAANKSLNFLKRANRLNIDSSETFEQLSELEDIEAKPEKIVIDSDVKDTLESIMAKLPEEQRTTLFLFYYQEMTVKEIAQIYQCSESTVRSRLAYARKFMRNEVEKMEDKGYKIRCITSLPFIFSLFNAQRTEMTSTGKGDIISELNAYVSSVPMKTENIQNNPEITNTSKGGNIVSEKGKFPKSAKLAITAVVLVIAVGAVIGIVINNNSKSENSTIVDNSSIAVSDNASKDDESKIDDESSAEESELSEDPKTNIDWEFRDVNAPTFKDSEYVTVMPYKDYESASEGIRQYEEIMASPSYVIDVNKAKEFIKNNDTLKNYFELAEAGLETQDFAYYDEIGTQVSYKFTDGIYGYKADKTDDKTSESSKDFKFTSSQMYNKYNAPREYKLT